MQWSVLRLIGLSRTPVARAQRLGTSRVESILEELLQNKAFTPDDVQTRRVADALRRIMANQPFEVHPKMRQIDVHHLRSYAARVERGVDRIR